MCLTSILIVLLLTRIETKTFLSIQSIVHSDKRNVLKFQTNVLIFTVDKKNISNKFPTDTRKCENR